MKNYVISLYLNELKKGTERLISYIRMMYYGKSNNKWLKKNIKLELQLIIKNCERLINAISFKDGM